MPRQRLPFIALAWTLPGLAIPRLAPVAADVEAGVLFWRLDV